MSRRAWIPATPGVETPGIEGTFPVEMADRAALATRIAEPSDSCAIGVPLLTIALSTPASLTAEPSRSWVCPENCSSASSRPTAVHPSASSRLLQKRRYQGGMRFSGSARRNDLIAEARLGQANGNVLHILELLGFHDRPSQRHLSDRFLVNDRGRRVHEPFCES